MATLDRRQFGALALAAASPSLQAAQPVESEIVRLKLRHTWTTVMSSSEFRDTLHVRINRDGVTGTGEGAPIVRYKESAISGQAALNGVKDYLATADLLAYRKVQREIFQRIPGEWAAKSAIDEAILDWVGQKRGLPVWALLGLNRNDAPITTFSIGIDNPETTRQKVKEAEPFPVLKIKVGLGKDEATIEAVRSVTNKPLRLDANEGFKSKEEAVEKIKFFEKHNVELIEQPLPAHMIEESRWVRSKVNMPIFADESCLHAADMPKIVGSFDGINIKLDKAGGILEALNMIQMAKSLGLKVMLGCMVSSSVTITAAAHLSPLVDYADLDGNLLVANDPYRGVKVEKGRLVLPDKPGLGLSRA